MFNQVNKLNLSVNRGVAFLATAAMILSGCAGAPEEAEVEVNEADQNVPASEVTDDTNELIGETVTIRSEAVAVGDETFVVSDENFLDSENILVINNTGEVFEVPIDGREVQVTGEVRNFVIADIVEEYDLDLDPDLYTEYENKAAIIAESLSQAPEPGEITKNPSLYYGQTLGVEGEVEEVYSEGVFTLDEEELIGAQDLLVLVINPPGNVEEGAQYAITGELRELTVTQIEQDYDITWDADLQETIEAEYQDLPILVAEGTDSGAVIKLEDD